MKQKIRIWLRNFFGFSRTETNGFIILLILMVAILSMPFLSKRLYSLKQQPLQSDSDETHLTTLLSELENKIKIKQKSAKEIRHQAFDLNKSDAQQLIKSGFPDFLAKRIVKYREKVKPFETKEELLKIYGIDSAFYNEIFPFIEITRIQNEPKRELKANYDNTVNRTPKKNASKEFKKEKIIPFDLNKADSSQLQSVYGIGPAYSKRIIKYREYLGGFHSIHQLKEVYGLKKDNLDSLEKYVFLAKELNIKKLKVNQLNADSLVQHPYISYKEANLIINYRNQHGHYTSAADLFSIKVLDSNWVKKITPYFTFD